MLAAAMAARGHEVWVVGRDGGPRYRENPGPRLTHIVRGGTPSQVVLPIVREIQADVVHIHRSGYIEGLVRDLAAEPGDHRPLVVSTPVFGRTPNDRRLLDLTRVCLVGTYTFYRFCKWLGASPADAVRKAGLDMFQSRRTNPRLLPSRRLILRKPSTSAVRSSVFHQLHSLSGA